MQPGVVFFENVEGHVSLGLRQVLGDLEQLGYRTTWGLFSAAEVGAPHQRKRVFILAHANGVRVSGSRNPMGQVGEAGQGRTAASTDSQLFHQRMADLWPARPNKPQHAWEPSRIVRETQPALGRDPHGSTSRMDFTDELRLLGNGVVPATAALAFTTLAQELGI